MNKIKFVARLHYIDPISGKRYNDAQLMTINQYYEDSFLTEKTLDKTGFILQFEENHPEFKGWSFSFTETKIEFTTLEKFQLVIDLYTPSPCYLAETIDDNPLGKRFLEYGFLTLETEHNVYKKNSLGTQYLHSFIKTVSENLIAFMRNNGCNVSSEKINLWFCEKYGLSDDDLRADVIDYIAEKNLRTYGYVIDHRNDRYKMYKL